VTGRIVARASKAELLAGAVVSALCALALDGLLASPARACDYTSVRDAAYDEPRDVHRLCVIARTDDAAARQIHDRLAAWLDSSGAGLNLELVYVAADDPQVQWKEYGIPSVPPTLPVVVLAGRRTFERQSFFIDYWEPAPSTEDLERLKTSPAREVIRGEVGRRVAVLLYMPGNDQEAGRAQQVIDSAVKSWAKKEPAGLAVVQVNRADGRERLLVSFTGVKDSGPDWLAVIFGRGKFMPPLEGEDVTEARLNGLIELVMEECTCLRPPASLGVDIPMTWDETLDDAVVLLRTSDGAPDVAADPSLASAAVDPANARPVLARAVWTFGALVVVVSITAAALVWRRRQSAV